MGDRSCGACFVQIECTCVVVLLWYVRVVMSYRFLPQREQIHLFLKATVRAARHWISGALRPMLIQPLSVGTVVSVQPGRALYASITGKCAVVAHSAAYVPSRNLNSNVRQFSLFKTKKRGVEWQDRFLRRVATVQL